MEQSNYILGMKGTGKPLLYRNYQAQKSYIEYIYRIQKRLPRKTKKEFRKLVKKGEFIKALKYIILHYCTLPILFIRGQKEGKKRQGLEAFPDLAISL